MTFPGRSRFRTGSTLASPLRRHLGLVGMARVVLDDDAWAAVRAAYENREEPVRAIMIRFGISKDQLYDRAAREAWSKRSETIRKGIGEVPAAPMPQDDPQVADGTSIASTAAALGTEWPPQTHEQRLERLHRIIDRLLARLERTMERNPNMSPQDQEKAARAVTQTVTAIERVSELANTQGKVPETDGGQSHERAEADRMRREIAERLERLSAKFSDEPAKSD